MFTLDFLVNFCHGPGNSNSHLRFHILNRLYRFSCIIQSIDGPLSIKDALAMFVSLTGLSLSDLHQSFELNCCPHVRWESFLFQSRFWHHVKGWCYVPAGYSVVGLPMILSGSKVVLVRLPSCSSKPVCYHSSVVLLCFNYNYRFTVIYLVISDIGKTLRAPNMCPVWSLCIRQTIA